MTDEKEDILDDEDKDFDGGFDEDPDKGADPDKDDDPDKGGDDADPDKGGDDADPDKGGDDDPDKGGDDDPDKGGDDDPDKGGDADPDKGGDADPDKDLDDEITKAAAEAEGRKLKADEEAAKGKGKSGEGGGDADFTPEFQPIIDKIGEKTVTTIGDDGKKKTVTVKEMAKEYPEMFQVAGIMAKALAGDSGAAAVAELQQVRAEIADLRFWNALTDPETGIPDARKIAMSKEFAEWTKKQSPEIQQLTHSPNPEHAKLVIKAYKNQVAKAGAKKVEKKAQGLSAVRRAAAKDTSAGGGAKKGAEAKDDFDAGFDED